MSEKTEKRLVSRKEYLRVVVKASIVPMVLLGGWWGCFSLIRARFVDYLLYRYWDFNYGLFGHWQNCVTFGILVSLLGVSLWYAFRKSKAGLTTALSSVTPITRHNTGALPAAESLVRASSLPSSSQQYELLRAAKPGQETPLEELLRATTGVGKEAS